MAVVAMIAVVGLGGLLLAWPAYREAAVLDGQTQELWAKGERYGVDTGLKPIPESADIAGLMRVLSLAVDGSNIRDQMFDAGDPKEAASGSGLTALATPLTIDMEARFDAVFALLRTAESMDRLLRVSTVQLVCKHLDEEEEPFAKATVVLEAVYNPPDERGEG
jgi:hypothetical protein